MKLLIINFEEFQYLYSVLISETHLKYGIVIDDEYFSFETKDTNINNKTHKMYFKDKLLISMNEKEEIDNYTYNNYSVDLEKELRKHVRHRYLTICEPEYTRMRGEK